MVLCLFQGHVKASLQNQWKNQVFLDRSRSDSVQEKLPCGKKLKADPDSKVCSSNLTFSYGRKGDNTQRWIHPQEAPPTYWCIKRKWGRYLPLGEKQTLLTGLWKWKWWRMARVRRLTSRAAPSETTNFYENLKDDLFFLTHPDTEKVTAYSQKMGSLWTHT